MSSVKCCRLSVSSSVLTCAIAFFCGTLFHRNGISTISAHCTNGANMHVSFHRNFNQTYALSAEQTVTAFLRKGQNARFSVRLAETSPLSVFIHADQVDAIIPQLFYNESVNLSKYFLTNISVYNIPCAPAGRYDILVASKSNVEINVNNSQQKPFLAQKLQQYVQTSRIRYENRIHKRQVLLKWEKSKLDIHAVHYCVSINTHGNQATFCDAMDHVIGKSPKLFCSRLKGTLNNYFFRPVDRITNIDFKRGTALVCSGARNRQIMAGLTPNKKYFVDVFGVHKKVPGLIFKLASTSFVFNCTSPTELREDQVETGRLTEFDKRTSFVFKQSNRTSRAMFLIIPCGHSVKVKISSLLKLKKTVDVTSATILKLNNLRNGDRILLKFSLTNSDDGLQRRNFKVVATTKAKFANYPMLPSDMGINEVTSLSTCTSSTITWNSSPDPRPKTYCITAIKIRVNSFYDFILNGDTCDVEKYQKKFLPNQHSECITSSRNESSTKMMERFKLTNLQPSHGYIIQITVKVHKEVISYQPLKLIKSLHCFKPIINDPNQLPIAMSSAEVQHNHIEDNNILTPSN